jgi:hypothetical protein
MPTPGARYGPVDVFASRAYNDRISGDSAANLFEQK